MYTKGIHGQVLIDTLSRYPWSTLDWYLIDNSVNTWLTSQSTVGWESINFCRHAIECWSIHKSQSTLSWLSTDCRSSVDRDVDWVSVACWPRCRLSADQEHWSTVDTWSLIWTFVSKITLHTQFSFRRMNVTLRVLVLRMNVMLVQHKHQIVRNSLMISICTVKWLKRNMFLSQETQTSGHYDLKY